MQAGGGFSDLLREESAGGFGGGDAADAEGEGGEAGSDFVFFALVFDLFAGAVENFVKPDEHFFAAPEDALEILHPFEIGDDDAAAVAEDVGNDLDIAAFVQDGIRAVGGRAVGRFRENPALERRGVFAGDDASESGGNQGGAGKREELFVGNPVAAVPAFESAVGVHVLDGGVDVQAVFAKEAAGNVADRDDFAAVFLQRDGGFGADVAETLDGDGCLRKRGFELFEGAHHEVGDAPAGGFAAAFGTADGHRFAGDDGGNGIADVGGVGVHHPGHDVFVGSHVGGHDVDVGADERNHFLHVAAGEAFHFAGGQIAGIDGDAAFCAAIGESGEGAFPAHPHGERGDFADFDAWVEADSAFGGAEREVMLDAETFVNGEFSVVAPDREGNGHAAFRVFGAVANFLGKIDDIGGEVELAASHVENVVVVKAGDHALSDLRNGFGPGRDGVGRTTIVKRETCRIRGGGYYLHHGDGGARAAAEVKRKIARRRILSHGRHGKHGRLGLGSLTKGSEGSEGLKLCFFYHGWHRWAQMRRERSEKLSSKTSF